MTAEEWAVYGVGIPDADGWYPDYRRPPEHLAPRPAAIGARIDGSSLALITHWRVVVAELAARGVNLFDSAVRDSPWPGVRALIYSLLDSPTRLREELTRR